MTTNPFHANMPGAAPHWSVPQPSEPHWPAPEAPKKKNRGRFWALMVALIGAALLCGLGVMIVAGVDTGPRGGTGTFTSTDPTIKIDTCEKTVISSVEIAYTLTNVDKRERTFVPSFDIVDSAGTRIGDASDFVGDLAAGGIYKGKAVGMLNVKDGRTFKCKLVDW